ncbi:MAG: hypothetical protein AAFQ43_10230 [Bacteroidota bacterium]
MIRFATPLAVLVLLVAPLAAQTAPEASPPPEASGAALSADSLTTPAPSILPDPTVEALAGLLLGSGDDPSLVRLRYRGAGEVQIVVDGLRADAAGFSTAGVRYTTEDTYYVPIPADVPEGASRDDLAAAIGLSDPSLLSPFPISSLSVRAGEVPLAEAAPGPGGERLRGPVALEAAPLDGLRLRLSGQASERRGVGSARSWRSRRQRPSR